MKSSASAPSLGNRAKGQRSQSFADSEHSTQSAIVSRWAGKLQSLTSTDTRTKRHDAKQGAVDGMQDRGTKSSSSLPAAGTTMMQPMRGKVTPANLLEGVSSVAQSANHHAQDRTLRLARISSKGQSMSASAKLASQENVVDGQALTQQFSQLASTMSEMKQQHDGFKPMTASEKARAALFHKQKTMAGGGSASLERSEEDAETWKDKIAAWKYVRSIEAELPPLVPVKREFAPVVHDQEIVKFNAQSEILQRSAPEAQIGWLAYRGVAREARRCIVSEMRARRRADTLMKRRDDAFRSLKEQDVEEDAEDDVAEDQAIAAHWMIALAMSSFAASAHEEIHIRNMSPVERESFLQVNQDRLAKSTSGFVQNAMVISKAMKEPETRGRMALLQSIFLRMIKIKNKRKNARAVLSCLDKWRGTGTLFLMLKRYVRRIIFLQQWWRTECMPRLAQVRNRLSMRWIRIERAELVRDFKAKDIKEAQEAPWTPPSAGSRNTALPMEDRIQLHLIQEHIRMRFIDNELRARRYMLLPQINMWEEDVKSWNREMQDWKETHEALAAIGVAGAGADEQVFRWPPQRPTYMPPEFGTERIAGGLEVLDMLRRAKASPMGGWLQIPKKVSGQPVSSSLATQTSKKKKNFQAGCDEENPFGAVSNEELNNYNLEVKEVPGDFPEDLPAGDFLGATL